MHVRMYACTCVCRNSARPFVCLCTYMRLLKCINLCAVRIHKYVRVSRVSCLHVWVHASSCIRLNNKFKVNEDTCTQTYTHTRLQMRTHVGTK